MKLKRERDKNITVLLGQAELDVSLARSRPVYGDNSFLGK